MVAALMFLLSGFFFVGSTSQKLRESPNYGPVHFENSCAPSVQQSLQQAIALLHSFEFGEASAAFRVVESGDPSCTIAAWGVALSNAGRQGADHPASFLSSEWKELQPWLSRRGETERERMYLEAVSKLYEGYENTSANERGNRYLSAMQQLRSKYPQDQEASIFYAIALSSSAGPGRAGIETRHEALNILLPLFAENPNHPGVAHYIIHAADTPD